MVYGGHVRIKRKQPRSELHSSDLKEESSVCVIIV
jgi:hypothetical protein